MQSAANPSPGENRELTGKIPKSRQECPPLCNKMRQNKGLRAKFPDAENREFQWRDQGMLADEQGKVSRSAKAASLAEAPVGLHYEGRCGTPFEQRQGHRLTQIDVY